MEQGKRKMARWKKVLLALAAAVAALAVAAAGTVWAMWGDEIATLASIEQIRARDDANEDGSVYTMHVRGGFYLDDFVAQGGVSSDEELIAFITDHITKGLVDMGIRAPEISCASFTARTEDGDALFARNYDFSKTNTCLVFTEANEGRHASISTADLQFLGIDVNEDLDGLMDRITCLAATYTPLDGVNDAGVACGIYMSFQGESTVPTDQDTGKPDFTSTTLLRLILDYADDLDEAVEIASSYDMHDSARTSYHYMVADASGRSAVLEWIGETDATDNDGAQRRLVVHYSDGDAALGEAEAASDCQWVTNFILQPGYYEGSSSADIEGRDRYDRIGADLTATGGVVADERAAMDILANVGRRSWDDGCTVHSAVYNLTDRSVLWIPNEHYDDPEAAFEFSLEP